MLPEDQLLNKLRTLSKESRRELAELAFNQRTTSPHGPGQPLGLGEHAASFAQERLWFLERAGASTAYQIHARWVLASGVPDLVRLAMEQLVQRHPALRTRFVERDDRLLQQIAPRVPLPLEVVDLRGAPLESLKLNLDGLSAVQGALPFDLTRGPLFRATLVRLESLRSVLLFSIHHIVSDGWSLPRLEADFHALLASQLGTPASLPPLQTDYAAFARWQRAQMECEGAGLVDWWRGALHKAPLRLALPLDHPRPPVTTHHGHWIPVAVPPQSSHLLSALLQAETATPFVAAIASYAALLGLVGGVDEVLIGIPSAGRDTPGVESVVGLFVNTLPIRMQHLQDSSLRSLVRQARQQLFAALAHQMLPFERLVDALAPPRDLGTAPVVQASLTMQDLPGQKAPALPETPLEDSIRFDLSLHLKTVDGALQGLLGGRTDLFNTETLQQLGRMWLSLLDAATAQPDVPIRDLLMPPDQAAAAPPPGPPPISRLPLEKLSTHDGAITPPSLPPPGLPVAIQGDSPDHVAAAVALVSRGDSVLLLDAGWPPSQRSAALQAAGIEHIWLPGAPQPTAPHTAPAAHARLLIGTLNIGTPDEAVQVVPVSDAACAHATTQVRTLLELTPGDRIVIGGLALGPTVVLTIALLRAGCEVILAPDVDTLLDALAWDMPDGVVCGAPAADSLTREGWADELRVLVHGDPAAACGLLGGPALGYAALAVRGEPQLTPGTLLCSGGRPAAPLVPGVVTRAGTVDPTPAYRAMPSGSLKPVVPPDPDPETIPLEWVEAGLAQLNPKTPIRVCRLSGGFGVVYSGAIPRVPRWLESVPVERLALPAVPEQLDAHAFDHLRLQSSQDAGPLLPLIQETFERVLKKPIPARESFFAHGGHSLLVARIVQELRGTLLGPVTLRDVFDHHTALALARHLDAQGCKRRTRQAAKPGPAELAPDDGVLVPLSPGQERLWFLYRFEPDQSAYNMAVSVSLPHAPAGLVRYAWRRLIQRHAALRLVFCDTPDGPRQKVTPLREDWQEWDTRGLSKTEVDRFVHLFSTQPYDLVSGPPARACYLDFTDRCALLIATHHIVSDGWSKQVLARELQQLVRGLLAAHPVTLPAISRPFLVRALAEHRRQPEDTALRWWKEQFEDFEGPPELPVDRPRTETTPEGFTLPLLIPLEKVDALKVLGAECRSSFFMVLMSLVGLLLQRWSGSQDICIGTPRAQRPLQDEHLVGFCVNTLPIRTTVTPQQTFRAHLAAVRDRILGVFDHEHVPFEHIVDALALTRDTQRNPLFETMCALQSVPGRTLVRAEGTDPAETTPTPCVSRFELSFFFTEVQEGLLGSIEYRGDLMDHDRILRYRAHLETLIDAVIARPDVPLWSLQICPAAELALIARHAHGPPGHTDDVWQTIHRTLLKDPGLPLLIEDGATMSREVFSARVAALSARLRAAGVGPGVPVAVATPRSAQAVIALAACFAMGAPYVPIDLNNPPRRRRFILRDSGAPVIISGGECGWVPDGVVVLPANPPSTERSSAALPAATVAPEAPAYVVYTSGSTGQPKGVAVPRRTVDNLIAWQLKTGHAPRDARTLMYAPLGFDVSIQEILSTLAGGGVLVLIPPELRADAAALLDHLHALEVQRVFLPPLVLRELCRARRYTDTGPALQEVICAGERLEIPVNIGALLAPEGRVVNQYGPSETHVVTAWSATGPPQTWPRLPPIGHPISGVTIRVLDEAGRPTPLGIPGELWIFGVAVGLHYLGRPELSRERFRTSPTEPELGTGYATGDRVQQNPDGGLVFLGRRDGQLKISGFRVEPGEIEAAIRRLEGVRDAAVGLTAGPAPVLVAWVELSRPVDVSEGLRQHLPASMLPQQIVPIEALPRTTSGKLDRRRLPAPQAAPQAPAGEARVSHVLRDLWADILKRPIPDQHCDFFAMGGNSLAAMRLALSIKESLGVTVSVRRLFDQPTLGGQVQLIESLEPTLPITTTKQPDAQTPASSSQKRLWLLAQQGVPSAAYLLSYSISLPAAIPREQVAGALERLALRHPALRSTLRSTDGIVEQVVHARLQAPLRITDLRGTPGHQQLLTALINAEATAPMDLERGPCTRALLVMLSDRSELLLTVHHAFADGWSLGIFDRELPLLLADRPLGPPPPSFAQWVRTQETREEGLKAFLAALSGADQILHLPTDRPRPEQPGHTGAARAIALSAPATTGLLALAQAEGVTEFSALLTLAGVLLARLSGQRDFLIGVPIANRTSAEFQSTVGFFANTVVVRFSADEDATFRDLVRQTSARLLLMQEHQDVPFDAVVRRLCSDRLPGVSPLFQVMVAIDDLLDQGEHIDPGQIDPNNIRPTLSKFDLSFSFELSSTAVVGVEYSTELFEHDTIHTWMVALCALAEAAGQHPDAPWEHLSVGTGSVDRAALPSLTDPASTRLAALAEHGDRIAISEPDGATTYEELARSAHALAGAIRQREARCIGVWLDRGRDLAVCWLGCWLAGGVLVPLDPALPPPRLCTLVEDAGIDLVVGPPGPRPTWAPAWLPLDTLSETETDRPQPPSGNAYVLYTSGSTGRPKGVQVGWAALDRYLSALRALIGLSPEDTVYAFASPAFDVALEEWVGPLAIGARIVPRPPGPAPSPEALLATCEAEQVTILSIPTAYFHVLAATTSAEAFPASIRAVVIGGEQVNRDALNRFAATGCPVWNMYGPTEATISATARLFDGPIHRRPSIGHPLPSVRAYVLGPNDAPLPPGIPGELCLGGGSLSQGYIGRQEETARAFPPDPFQKFGRMYRTGDRVLQRTDGELVFLDRIDAQVQLRGFRVELGEVEATLHSLDGVTGAIAAATPHGQLVAAVTVRSDAATSTEVLRQRLAANLPYYSVPDEVHILESLPTRLSGKPDRAALLARFADRSTNTEELSPTEQAIAEIWSALLGREVGLRQSFFASGGHSLLLLQLRARLRATFGIALSLQELTQHPTIDAQALLLASAQTKEVAEPAQPIPHQERSCAPLSPLQEGLFFLSRTGHSGSYNLPLQVRFEEPVVVDCLHRAIQQLTLRHASLRTRYHLQNDTAIQELTAPPEKPFVVLDLRGIPERQQLAERLLGAGAVKPVDLEKGSFHARLLTLEDDRHILQLTLHHIAVDGHSLDILRRDLRALYGDALRGVEPDLDSGVSYIDYAIWEQTRLSGAAQTALLRRWSQHLQGAPSEIALPLDRPRAAPASNRGEWVSFPLSGLAPIRSLAASEKTTHFAVAAALWAAFLWRLSGQTDLVFGVPVSHRPHPDLDPVVGYFVNTVPMRTVVAPGESFRALVQRVSEHALTLHELQSVPLPRIVQHMAPERSGARSPLFEVVLAYQVGAASGDRSLTTERGGCQAKYDLTLLLEEHGEHLHAALEFRTALWRSETIDLWRERLLHFVDSALAQPDLPLCGVVWPPSSEAALIPPLQGPAPVPLDPITGLMHHRWRRPRAIALRAFGEDLSYIALVGRIGSVVAHLRQQGLTGARHRIAICFSSPLKQTIAALACLAAGVPFIPLDSLHPAARQAQVIAAVRPDLLLDDDTGLPEGHAPLSPAAVPLDATAYILFTSGSTGKPKGVVVSRGALGTFLKNAAVHLSFTERDRCSVLGSSAFDAHFLEVLAPLAVGAQLVLGERKLLSDLDALVAWFAEHQITLTYLPTPIVNLLHGSWASLPASLRAVTTGGSRLERWPTDGPVLHNFYGPTETTIAVTACRRPDRSSADRPTIGHPMGGVVALVLDPEGAPVPIGAPGELYIGGPQVSGGYLERPEETEHRFIVHPEHGRMYRTGDRVRWCPDGQLDFLGRLDQQVQIRGVRVEPGEVAAVLLGLPGVRAAHAAGIEGSTGVRLLAWVATDEPVGSLARRQALQKIVPAAMVPDWIGELVELPLTPTGKIDAKQLPVQPPRSPEPTHTLDPIATRISDLIQELLSVPAVAGDADFFALGGHSLAAMQLLARLQSTFGVSLAFGELLQRPVLDEMALRVLMALVSNSADLQEQLRS